jgi:membrane protein DedA with SNARE-associated domain
MKQDVSGKDIAKREKKKNPRVAFAVIISIAAIIIISFAIGKDIYEGRSQTLTSFSLIHFAGYLFFLLMPVVMAFIVYLTWYDEITLIWFALVTAITAQYIDYLIGFTINSSVVMRFINEKRILRAEKYINRYGNLTVFLFNFLPLSSPIIALAAGVLKFSLKDLFIYSFAGLLLKYTILSLIAGWAF